MSRYLGIIGLAKYFAALCLIGCVAFIGCKQDADFVMPVEDENSETTDDSKYESWVRNFSEEMKKSGSVGTEGFAATQVAAGTTGSAPAFNFATVATTGAVPAFNFAAVAATTGSVPSFNFNAAVAATTGDAPTFNFAAPAASNASKSFDFGAAATTSDSAPTFDFANCAKKNAEEKAA